MIQASKSHTWRLPPCMVHTRDHLHHRRGSAAWLLTQPQHHNTVQPPARSEQTYWHALHSSEFITYTRTHICMCAEKNIKKYIIWATWCNGREGRLFISFYTPGFYNNIPSLYTSTSLPAWTQPGFSHSTTGRMLSGDKGRNSYLLRHL